MNITIEEFDGAKLNNNIRKSNGPVTISGVCGERFIGAGLSDKEITVYGVPGNALGAYLNGADITVYGNAQDATGDTMNAGRIIIHGNIGDAAGYAMRGGEIFVKGNAGYRAGIHMKEYNEKRPVLVIGGNCGSFLGEYLAGGIIIVLGLTAPKGKIVGNFTATGMHGGKIFLRSDCRDVAFPKNVTAAKATDSDLKEIKDYLKKYCDYFDEDLNKILSGTFTKVVPDSKNPYQQMYVAN